MRQIKITKQITIRESLTIDKYFQDISRVRLLTAEEEVELTARIQDNDYDALERLTKANLRFVVSIAKQYQNQGLPLSDLINEGNLGLIKAAQRFDHTRGFKFISYAVWWIRQSILQSLAEHSRLVRIPANKVGMLNKLNKTIAQLEQEYGREPTEDELAEILNVKSDEITDFMKTTSKPVSIDDPVGEEQDMTIMHILEDKNSPPPEKDLMDESLKKELKGLLLKALTPVEAKIIIYFFGLNGTGFLSVEELANELDISGERVRQLKEKAIRKLRKSSHSDLLKNYLG